MRRRLLLLAGLVGCGRIGFTATTTDASATDAPAPDTGATFDPTACPASYTLTVPATTTRYRWVTSSATDWLLANADCRDDGPAPGAFTHLAVFTSQAEQDALTAIIDDAWVGYSDRLTEGAFLAISAEPLGAHLAPGGPAWTPGEPNNQTGSENCLHVKFEGGLNDVDCDLLREYLCECDGYADEPARY